MEINEVLKKVKSVNDKIKEHNKLVEEQKALRKIRIEQLKEKCENFKREFNVDLYNDSFEKMEEVVSNMLEVENERVNKELEKAEELLNLIENGNYNEVSKKLGTKPDDSTQEDSVGSNIKDENSKKSNTEPKKYSDNLLDIMEELEEDPKPIKSPNKLSEDSKNELEDIGLDDLFDFD